MNPTLVVMRKELKELFRDKRVRSNAIIMPMLLIIGMLFLFGFLMGVGEKKNQKIHVVGSGENLLLKHLKEEGVQIIAVSSATEGEEMIKTGKARLVLSFEQNFDDKVAKGLPTPVKAYYDSGQETGKLSLGIVGEELGKLNQSAMTKVLTERQIDPASLAPIQLQPVKVQVGKSDTSDFLISLLPYFIVIWAFYGGFGSAGDLVAGEKEKMTLETLLIAPVGRSQIAFGKFLSLATVCLLSSLSAVAGFFLAGISGLPMFSKIFPKGLGIGFAEFGVILLVLLPTVAFFASLLIAISTYAKNSREAQSYLAVVSFLVLMPAIFGQFIGFTDLGSNLGVRFVPVLNTSLAVREALQGKTNLLGVGITVLTGAVLAYIGIRIAVHLFKREQVLTRV